MRYFLLIASLLVSTTSLLSAAAPVVRITHPPDGSVFGAPANIHLLAYAADQEDGTHLTVEFFAGTNSIGFGDFFVNVWCPTPVCPNFMLNWPNVPPGNYVITAKATDTSNTSTVSVPVHIVVSSLPVVTAHAPDSLASESGDGGAFTISRSSGTNTPLQVHYLLRGSASNGVDYLTLSNSVTIPTGAFATHVPVKPIDDSLDEPTELVELRLAYASNTAGYLIGSPSNAFVHIADNDPSPTNVPPAVRISTPADGSFFHLPANVLICADAHDIDGYVSTVEFFAGTNSLGILTNNPLGMGPLNPFCLTWSNAPSGEHMLRAKATDNAGAISHSTPVRIRVLEDFGMPFVTIRATDPHASEGPFVSNTNIAVFTVYRTEPTNVALTVYYTISGSASNGLDYTRITNEVVIPAGSFSANILIYPVDDNLMEPTESVVLTLTPMACIAIWPPPPECYLVATPSSAAAFIDDNDRIVNAPPKVQILSPSNGAVFVAPTNLTIVAQASDPDDAVARVDFFVGNHFLGSDVGTNQNPYSIVWSNALPGLYSLQARALDTRGGVGFSEPVRITITGTNAPPTNLPPVVTIFAIDSLAGEGTNCCRWYSNIVGVTNHYLCTNNAAFLVRRTGPTNAPLTVHYAIGGTASNGVDYAAIATSVTIPTGERSARIHIIPLDDTVVECPETVVLGLVRLTNSTISYIPGWPSKAAATIVDNDRSPPGTTLLCDGTFHLCIRATNGLRYRLECSLDLVNWLPLGTNIVSEADIYFTDPESAEFPNRFYRAVPLE